MASHRTRRRRAVSAAVSVTACAAALWAVMSPAAAAGPGRGDGCHGGHVGYPPVQCAALVTRQDVRPGARIGVAGDSFAPHEAVDVALDEETNVVAVAEATGRGDVRVTVTVPAEVRAGSHRLLLVGRRSATEMAAPLTVVPVSLSTPLDDPSGPDTPTLAVAVAAVIAMLGLMLFVGGRRRYAGAATGGLLAPPSLRWSPRPGVASAPDASPAVEPSEPSSASRVEPEVVVPPPVSVAHIDSDDPTQLLQGLREENDALRARVAQLEEGIAEYRRQMADVLTSASWRVTAPLRNSAGKVRLVGVRVKRLPRRLVTRSRPALVPTAGLFPPAAPPAHSLATADSPLLSRPHRASRRARNLDVRHNKVLVVAHVYYPEVWYDIEDRLARMPEAYDLIVALVRGRAESLERHIKRRFPFARIQLVENYGRDLGSLLELANRGAFEGYDAILKVHTKRSPHRLDGDAWRVELLDGVLPSPEGIRRFLDLLRADRDVGLIAPTGHLKGPETWGSDRELVEALAARVPVAFDPDQLLYPAGSMYWARPWVLQRLADLGISAEHFEAEADHLDGSTAHALERFIGIVARSSGLDVVEARAVPSRLNRARRASSTQTPPKVLAFYLPQYHAVPENDEWWGEGFTDWVKVDAAKPLYDGHLQPHEPAELGHYDLANPDVMRVQANLARTHGVDGFVMYHYWFDGRKLLDTPLRNLLADPTVDMPFALCWANENWTRRWDGLDKEILIAQSYPDGWADAYFDDIVDALRDPRYLHVGGTPMLLVYRPGHLRDGREAILRWRQRALEAGLPGLHVLGVVPSRDFEDLPRGVAGVLDGLVRFPPGSGVALHSVRALAPGLANDHAGDVFSYDAAVDGADLTTVGPQGLPIHPGVMPGWDNTARRGRASYVFHGANPASFRRWLARAVVAAAEADRMVFVNAWNEWAEGAHLEPDARFGRGNLEAVRDVVGVQAPSPRSSPGMVEPPPETLTEAIDLLEGLGSVTL